MSATQTNIFSAASSSSLSSGHAGASGGEVAIGALGTRLKSDVLALAGAMLEQLKQTFKRAPQPLALDYGSQVLRFPSPNEFEFALSARVMPPASRLADWEHLTLFELRRMATDIRKLEHRYAEVMTAALERGRSLGRLFTKLDLKAFSSDHDWRSIFAALSESEHPRLDAYRHVALAKYMQYLRNRQAVIQHLYTSRSAQPVLPAGGETGQPASAACTPANGDQAAPQNLQETAIFDFSQLEATTDPVEALWLLPRGESVGITLADGEAVELGLANYAFRIESDNQVSLLDAESGMRYALRRGRNTVGRDRSCDVVVDLNYKEVSRRHLVIDCIDDHTLILVDMSSHGTRVPASRVIGARPADDPMTADRTMVGAGPAPGF